MIILKEKVAGYNNVLTLATKDMKFGVNENVNYVKPVATVKPTQITPKSGSRDSQPPSSVQTNNATVFPKIDGTTYLLGSAVTLGFLVARYVI